MTPPPDNDLVRVRHMLEAAQHAHAFVAGRSRADLGQDVQLQFAVVRAIEIIGEAASRLSPDFKTTRQHIPWAAIQGMRNRLIHAYFDINLDILWETVTTQSPT